MGVREKLDALKGITEEQQEYGTEVLRDLGILYDDGTIEGVNDNIPRMVARIDDSQTSSEYVWSSQKTQYELTNVAANASSALLTAISTEAVAREAAVSAEATAREAAVSAEATAREAAVSAEATARSESINEITELIPSNASTTNKLATVGDIPGGSSAIMNTESSTSFSLSDAADAPLAGLVVEGRTTKTGDVINNVGDNGFGVTSCGKNWLPTDKGSNHFLRALTAKRNADGSIYISGTCTGGSATYFLVGSGWNYASGVKNLLKKNTTYTISGGNVWKQRIDVLAYNSDNTQAEFSCLAPGSSTYEKRTSAATTGYPVFVTPDIDDLSYVIYIRIEENEVVNFTFTPQIELGSTATAFEPYKGSTAPLTTGLPLCSVGDVKDEVDYNRGVVIKRTGKINLKTAEWENNSQHASVGGFSLSLSNSNNGAISLVLSSYPYDNVTNFFWGNFDTYNDNTAYKNSGNNNLYIKDTRYTTLENFVAHFGNDDAVVYELAEPYEVPMTTAELTAYHALRTYEGTANITATDNPTMTVDYLLDTENGKAVGKVTENLDGRMDLQQLQLNDHEQRIADLEDAMTSMLVGG